MLFSEPKIPQPSPRGRSGDVVVVSVLFSEPKIPQPRSPRWLRFSIFSFSALQRAENSSTIEEVPHQELEDCFSALQRAENSSTNSVGGYLD